MMQKMEYMLNLLREIQEIQMEVMSKGLYSFHLEAAQSSFYENGIYLDVTIFKENKVLGTWDFHYLDEEEILATNLSNLRNFVKEL